MEENKPNVTDSEGSELKPAEGTEDVSQLQGSEANASEAEYYQKITGRDDIKSKGDFEKHYEGLKNLVGDQSIAEMRKKAEAFEKIQSAENNTKKGGDGNEVEGRLNKLEDELKTERFLKQYPESNSIIGSVKAKAKEYGVSLEEAYAKPIGNEKFSIQDLLATKLEVDKAKAEEKSISVESKGRITSEKSNKISQLAEEVDKTDSERAKQDLVREYLS